MNDAMSARRSRPKALPAALGILVLSVLFALARCRIGLNSSVDPADERREIPSAFDPTRPREAERLQADSLQADSGSGAESARSSHRRTDSEGAATDWLEVPLIRGPPPIGEFPEVFFQELYETTYEEFKRCVGPPDGRPERAIDPTVLHLHIETLRDLMRIADVRVAHPGYATPVVQECLVRTFKVDLPTPGVEAGRKYRVEWKLQFRAP